MATKSRSSSPARARSKHADAIGLLKADHRQVEAWFSQFTRTKNQQKKRQIAIHICDALTVHATIEEEIFYPAFIEATGDKDTHHEAVVEHAGAKKLIAEIQAAPDDDYYDAKVTVLSEMIKHHVKEEEQPGGMFSEAKKSDMDLQALGEQLLARKQELQATAKAA